MCKVNGLFIVAVRHNKSMILVNEQFDTQFFMYVYFYALHLSGSHVPIIRRIIVSMRHLVYVDYLQGSYQDARSTEHTLLEQLYI